MNDNELRALATDIDTWTNRHDPYRYAQVYGTMTIDPKAAGEIEQDLRNGMSKVFMTYFSMELKRMKGMGEDCFDIYYDGMDILHRLSILEEERIRSSKCTKPRGKRAWKPILRRDFR